MSLLATNKVRTPYGVCRITDHFVERVTQRLGVDPIDAVMATTTPSEATLKLMCTLGYIKGNTRCKTLVGRNYVVIVTACKSRAPQLNCGMAKSYNLKTVIPVKERELLVAIALDKMAASDQAC